MSAVRIAASAGSMCLAKTVGCMRSCVSELEPLRGSPGTDTRYDALHGLQVCGAPSPRHLPDYPTAPLPTRRALLHAAVVALPTALAPIGSPLPAAAAGAAGEEDAPSFLQFASADQGYSLSYPAGWERVDKPGADLLLRDPARKTTTTGVTVLPVRINSLPEFGDLPAVGERLLQAERAKDSTLSVAMVEQTQRDSPAGPLYDFQYELESTRGRKRILSSVTIAGGKLYILNATAACSKESCGEVEGAVGVLRGVARSFAVAAPS